MSAVSKGEPWSSLVPHRIWLLEKATELLSFHRRNAIDVRGGFHDLDNDGSPLQPNSPGYIQGRQLHATARMVHCFAAAKLMGIPDSTAIIDHGMSFLWTRHRDQENGGYAWSVNATDVVDSSKQAYGHAFVLLAASSAKAVGHPDADRMIEDVTEVIEKRFWQTAYGASADEFSSNWQSKSFYSGQNSNMHLTEALMAAYEATTNSRYLDMAKRIAELIIGRHAAANEWMIPEHFTLDWQVDHDFVGDPVFKPSGSTPGHWLEWSRLILQLWELDGRRQAWMFDAAEHLFRTSVARGWDHRKGGFYYTVGWDGKPAIADRYWWPCCEGIGAAHFLNSITPDPFYESWYQKIWDFTSASFIDKSNGGWFPQIDVMGMPSTKPFFGKPDLYHSVQACLIPLLPTNGSIIKGLLKAPGVRVQPR